MKNVIDYKSTLNNLLNKKLPKLFRRNKLNPYTYIIIRKDLPLVQQIVQSCHAALEAGFRFERPQKTSYLILLEVNNKTELIEAQEYLGMNEIKFESFYEPDYNRGLTAVATEPLIDPEKRKLLKTKYNSWKA